jgi:MoaA/NifB/PqqE/SkfB family radical SAM enzyme
VNGGKIAGHDNIFFDESKLVPLLQSFRVCGVKSITWTGGGEPTSHPGFRSITQTVNMLGIEQGLFTNALLPIKYDSSIFEWIRITKTNRPFPEENILNLLQCKTVGLCINYARGDEQIIENGMILIEKLYKNKLPGHSVYLQIRPEMNTGGDLHECLLPAINHPLVELTQKIAITPHGRGYTKCEAYHFVPFIWQNGEVNVCAYHKGEPEFILGNVYKQSFEDIMTLAPKNVAVISSCQACCKLHEMNLAIEHRKNLKDINFI